MLNIGLSTLLKWYKQPEVCTALVRAAEGREIAVRYGERGFGKRPAVLRFPKDVLEFAKEGASSFHISEERWSDPMQLSTGMSGEEVTELRDGWDLLLDIDGPDFELNRVASALFAQAIIHNGVNADSLSIKFSGNRGFHLAVPFETFPETVNGVPIASLFPEGPRRIATYLSEIVHDRLAKELLAQFSPEELAKRTGKKISAIIVDGKLQPYELLELDTVAISSRHMYRGPWCFNEKRGLLSIPVTLKQLKDFSREDAHPRKVSMNDQEDWLKTKDIRPGEAARLLIQALDFVPSRELRMLQERRIENRTGTPAKERTFDLPEQAIAEPHFPPCIKRILLGLQDGRKRSLFALINFLLSCSWTHEQIESVVNAWNAKNKPPLEQNYVIGQLRYAKSRKKVAPPPNCANRGYYIDIGVCHPDTLCGGPAQTIRNPLNYAKKRVRFAAAQPRKTAKKASSRKKPAPKA